MTSCGMVEPVRGSSIIERLAASTALRTASETSLALPVAMPDLALAVAHRHQRVEREPAAALHHLGHPVDGDDVLDVLARAIAVAPVTPWAAPAAPVTPLATTATPPARAVGARGPLGNRRTVARARRSPRRCPPRQTVSWACLPSHLPLELQSAFACAVGDGLHTTMVTVTCPVEHHFGDPGRLGLLGQQLAGALGAAHLGLRRRPESLRSGRSRPAG